MEDIEARKTKPKNTTYKITDGKGLYLLVNSSGGKLWRYDFAHEGKRKTLALGAYPEVSLAEARSRHTNARKLLASGIDPMAERKATKDAKKDAEKNSFKNVALEYFSVRGKDWSERHRNRMNADMERDIFPWIGAKPIKDVTAPDLLKLLRSIVDRGAEETARRVRESCGSVFRYGMATGRTDTDPTLEGCATQR